MLGAWGDRHGRKNVLVFAMFLMGVSTFLVGVLPTYAQVGVLAPLLLVVLRVVQGFAVAGELGGASAMIVEHSPDARRGFFASFSLQGTQAGSILATGALLPLAAFLPTDAFQTWGWRIPFLLSAVVILAGYIIRRRVQEPPAFAAQADTAAKRRLPFIDLLRTHPWEHGAVHPDDLHQRDRLGDARLRRVLREPPRATASASPPATCSG